MTIIIEIGRYFLSAQTKRRFALLYGAEGGIAALQVGPICLEFGRYTTD